MSNAHPDDMERLASRLAMIVSDDGEAGNAGVAAAHLARRMGLTGGQLKAIVLSGAIQEGAGARDPEVRRPAADQALRAERLEREAAGLRHSLHQLDVEVRRAQEEAEQLREVGSTLRRQVAEARASLRAQRWLAGAIVALIVVGSLGWQLVPGWSVGRPAETAARVPGTPAVAIGRVPGAEIHSEPDRGSTLVARLAVGEKVDLRQLVWRNLNQWAEVETGGRVGYVSTNDVELP